MLTHVTMIKCCLDELDNAISSLMFLNFGTLLNTQNYKSPISTMEEETSQ
jgi:hypothetical protein